MVDKETIRNFLMICQKENISPNFAFGFIETFVEPYSPDNSKVLSLDECRHWAIHSIYSLDEIKEYFWNGR